MAEDDGSFRDLFPEIPRRSAPAPLVEQLFGPAPPSGPAPAAGIRFRIDPERVPDVVRALRFAAEEMRTIRTLAEDLVREDAPASDEVSRYGARRMREWAEALLVVVRLAEERLEEAAVAYEHALAAHLRGDEIGRAAFQGLDPEAPL